MECLNRLEEGQGTVHLVAKILGRLAAWLDRRRAPRRRLRAYAFYWDGVKSTPHDVRDISGVGAYVVTDMKWYPGTIMDLTIGSDTNPSRNGPNPSLSPTISSRVIRADADGIGVEFLYENHQQRRRFERFLKKMFAASPRAMVNPTDPSAAGV